jgi:Protein of unknown function (DUF4125)
MDQSKALVVNEILEIEVEMFLRVRTADEPSCRTYVEDMRLHRRGQFAAWSEQTCRSYLEDLREAESAGDNLMTIKYARMDDLIPPYSRNPRIGDITTQFVDWQRDIMARFPNIMRGGRDMDGFTNYLRSELETYSDETLELLWQDVELCRDSDVNMSVEVYRYLATHSGFDTLEAMEQRLA